MAPKPAQPLNRLLIFVGLVLLGLCVATVIREQDTLAGVFAVLGLGTMVLAALLPRLTGPVEMGLSGFKLQLAQLSETGRASGFTEKDILVALEQRLGVRDAADRGHQRATSDTKASLPTPEDHQVLRDDLDETVDEAAIDQFNLAVALRERYLASDNPQDLHGAQAAAERALKLTPPAHPRRSAMLSTLAGILLARYKVSGNPPALDRAVAALQEILASSPTNSPEYRNALRDLATAVRMRYERTGNSADQDQVIALLRELDSARRDRTS